MSVLSPSSRNTRKNTHTSKIDFDDFFDTKLKEMSKHNESNNKNNNKNNINKMSNSAIIYDIAKDADPNKCPSNITREMLIQELDCEDLRSREKKNPGSVKIEELWAAYVNINMHIFSKYKPPKQNHKSITTLINLMEKKHL